MAITFSVRFTDARHTHTHRARERENDENIMVFSSVFVRWLLMYVLCTFLCAYRTKTFYRTHANNTRICLYALLTQHKQRAKHTHTDSHTHTQRRAVRQAGSSPCNESIIFYRWVRIHRQFMNSVRRKTGLKVPFHLSARWTHAVAHMMSAFELHSLLGISSSSSSSLVFLFLLL